MGLLWYLMSLSFYGILQSHASGEYVVLDK